MKKKRSVARQVLKDRVSEAQLKHFADPQPLVGADIQRFNIVRDLHLTETGVMLGLNTSALYNQKNKNKTQSAAISILLRSYAAFPELQHRIEPPSIESMYQMIKKIDPSVTSTHLGVALGLEPESYHRIRRSGIENSSQTTKVLCYLIFRAIKMDRKNWFIIKKIVETEAQARNIVPADEVWDGGGWNAFLANTEG